MPDANKPNILHRLADFISNYWTDVLLPVLPVVAAVCVFIFTDEFIKFWTGLEIKNINETYLGRFKMYSCIAFFLAVGGAIVVIFFHIRKQPGIEQLKIENAAMKNDRDSVIQRLRACITGYLFGVSTDLEMTNTDRISIYGHDSELSSFIQLYRISPNPVWEKRGGRYLYPDNEGYIAQAWQNGTFFVGELPDYEEDRRGYVRETSQCGFPKNLHATLRMKSRLYYGWRISNQQGNKPLAVLILESTNPVRWDRETLDTYFATQSEKFCSIFERVYKTLPELSEAAKRGL